MIVKEIVSLIELLKGDSDIKELRIRTRNIKKAEKYHAKCLKEFSKGGIDAEEQKKLDQLWDLIIEAKKRINN